MHYHFDLFYINRTAFQLQITNDESSPNSKVLLFFRVLQTCKLQPTSREHVILTGDVSLCEIWEKTPCRGGHNSTKFENGIWPTFHMLGSYGNFVPECEPGNVVAGRRPRIDNA